MKVIFHPKMFKLGLVVAVIAISYLAFTPLQHEIAEQATDKINHFIAFVTLALLVDGGFPPWKNHWARKSLILIGYGLFIECVQAFIPCRQFSLLDVLADSIGVGLYYCTAYGVGVLSNKLIREKKA